MTEKLFLFTLFWSVLSLSHPRTQHIEESKVRKKLKTGFKLYLLT